MTKRRGRQIGQAPPRRPSPNRCLPIQLAVFGSLIHKRHLSGLFNAEKRLMEAFSKQIPVALLAIDDGKHAPVDEGNTVYA